MNAAVLIAKVAGYSLLAWFVLWVLFLAVMALKRAQDEGKLHSGVAYYLGLSVLVIGYVADFLVNLGPATLLFLELPQEKTVTERCNRHLLDDGWRGAIAHWLCSNLLDPFQIGGHCH